MAEEEIANLEPQGENNEDIIEAGSVEEKIDYRALKNKRSKNEKREGERNHKIQKTEV